MQRTVWKEFEIKKLHEYHDLYVQIDTSILDDVFETFRSRGIVIFKSDSTFFLAPGLGWQAALTKAKVQLELLTDIDILLMIEKGIRCGICHAIHWYAEANNKYIRYYNRTKEISYLM